MNRLTHKKTEMRRKLIERRHSFHKHSGFEAAQGLCLIFKKWWKEFYPLKGKRDVVAGYWPLSGEIDVRPVLDFLKAEKVETALPVMKGKEEPLLFREWKTGDPLEKIAYGVMQPKVEFPLINPSVIIVPMVAFDAQGNRLGYGGGYYDRTLAEARKRGSVMAIGVAYAEQECDRLPVMEHDQPLDWIVTEQWMKEYKR